MTHTLGKGTGETRSAWGLTANHAVSSWLHDWTCCSLPLVNNIPAAKYVSVMIMHIPPDRLLPHTFLTTAVYATQNQLCKKKTSVFGGPQMIFAATNQRN